MGRGLAASLAFLALACQPTSPIVSAPVAPAARVEGQAPPPIDRGELFREGQVWAGEYECPQGTTELRLRIHAVRDTVVEALFEFRHAPTAVEGKYELTGGFDAKSRRVTLEPRAWIVRPNDYTMVGMEGTVSPDGDGFSGHITNEACGDFSLRRK